MSAKIAAASLDAAGGEQFFAAARFLARNEAREPFSAAGLFAAADSECRVAGHAEVGEEPIDANPQNRPHRHRQRPAPDSRRAAGWAIRGGRWPGLDVVSVVFLVEVSGQRVVPPAMGQGQGVSFRRVETGPEHGGQRRMKAEKPRCRRRERFPPQPGPPLPDSRRRSAQCRRLPLRETQSSARGACSLLSANCMRSCSMCSCSSGLFVNWVSNSCGISTSSGSSMPIARSITRGSPLSKADNNAWA